MTCSIDGCEKKVHARAWCATHHSRWYKYGSPLVVNQTGRRRLRVAGYIAAHGRVYKDLGKASGYDCLCGDAATQWAYDHQDPNELIGDNGRVKGLRYSLDPAHYLPMCKPCHIKFDADARAEF
jgi:hypothetical protein